MKNWNAKIVPVALRANTVDALNEQGIHLGRINVVNLVDSLVAAMGHNEFRSLASADLKPFYRTAKSVLDNIKTLHSRHAATGTDFTAIHF